MCYEDVKLGRQTKSRVYTTGGTLDIPANGKRIGLWLATDQGRLALLEANVNGVLCTVAYAANYLVGSAEFAFSPPVYIDIRHFGDLLFGPFRLSSPLGGSVTLIETYLDDGPNWKP
jgi:hypothetical protein